MQYIPPIMVIVGLCSMNEKFIPFTLSKIGLLVATVVVALAYALLQYVVSQYHENPKWWTDFPARLYERFGEVGLDIGRIFRGLRVTRSGTPDDLQASSESA